MAWLRGEGELRPERRERAERGDGLRRGYTHMYMDMVYTSCVVRVFDERYMCSMHDRGHWPCTRVRSVFLSCVNIYFPMELTVKRYDVCTAVH